MGGFVLEKPIKFLLKSVAVGAEADWSNTEQRTKEASHFGCLIRFKINKCD
jgi:hypothetical protein